MKTDIKTKPTANGPLSELAAELEACRKAVDFCFTLAMGQEEVEETWPRAPWNKLGDLNDRFHVMDMAMRLMEASGALAESMAKAKSGGELRQAITVDRFEHGPTRPPRGQNLSAQRLKDRRETARAIQLEGEGGAPESEKRMGE